MNIERTKRKYLRLLSKESPEPIASSRARIQKAMEKWQTLDQPGKLLGRGLGRDELIGRVAREVGASSRQVRSAIKVDRTRQNRL